MCDLLAEYRNNKAFLRFVGGLHNLMLISLLEINEKILKNYRLYLEIFLLLGYNG